MHADDIEAGRLGDDSRHRPGSPDEIAGRAVAGAHHASATPQRGDRPGPGEAELLVDRRREQDCDRAVLRGAEKPLEPDDHGCHSPLHVTRPPPLEPAVADQRKERVDRHSLHRHGVLVGIPENGRSPGDCRLETGQDVVAAGGDRLPGPGEASGAEALHEIVGDPTLEVLRPRDVTPHRVDTGATDEVGKRRQGICHGQSLANSDEPPPRVTAGITRSSSGPAGHARIVFRGMTPPETFFRSHPLPRPRPRVFAS